MTKKEGQIYSGPNSSNASEQSFVSKSFIGFLVSTANLGELNKNNVVTRHCVPRAYMDIPSSKHHASGYSIDFWFPSGLPVAERAFDHKLDFTEHRYVDVRRKMFMVYLEVHFPRELWDENWFDYLHKDLSKAPVAPQLGSHFRIVSKAPMLGAEKLFKTEIPLQGTDRYWIMPLDKQLRAKLIIGCQGTFFGRDRRAITTGSAQQNVNLWFGIFASNLRADPGSS